MCVIRKMCLVCRFVLESCRAYCTLRRMVQFDLTLASRPLMTTAKLSAYNRHLKSSSAKDTPNLFTSISNNMGPSTPPQYHTEIYYLREGFCQH